MKRFVLLRVLLCACVLAVAAPAFAAKASPKTAVPGLFRYTLPNGLELFVMENDAAPLAYIEIAVRAGGVTQVPETTGLFHLYEHMMFKGNAKYANQAAVTAAINEMGVADWNGTTGVDRVNYFFTVPSALVRDGLEFWSYAIRTPLMDEKELENEKSVVISEIGAHYSDPSRIVPAALATNLFAESPWQLDSSGMPETVQQATVETLRAIQKRYYVPNNAALFVGGDVQHEHIYKLVQEIYGDWERGGDLPSIAVPTKTPYGKGALGSHKKLVYADPRSSDSYIQVVQYLRGADGETDAALTYGGDVWVNMLSHPASSYAQLLMADEALSIPDADYVGGFYVTRRASSVLGFSAVMLTSQAPVEQAERYFAKLTERCIPDFFDADTFLAPKAIAAAKQRMGDKRVYSLETAEGLLSDLSALWASCGADYFLSYDKHIAAVNANDIKSFLQTYVADAHGLQIVFVSPALYEAHKTAFANAGYEELTAENSFWWEIRKNKEQNQ